MKNLKIFSLLTILALSGCTSENSKMMLEMPDESPQKISDFLDDGEYAASEPTPDVMVQPSAPAPVSNPPRMKASPLEIVYDKTTYTLSCGYFDHDFNIQPATKGLDRNFYLPLKNVELFKNDYNKYQESFNKHVYQCSKPKTIEGKQKIEGSTVVREEIVETFNPTNCSKFDILPTQNSFDKWLNNPLSNGVFVSADEFRKTFEELTVFKLPTELVEFNKVDLDTMMNEFKMKVIKYNFGKDGELFSPS
jgi:hypothetical protein